METGSRDTAADVAQLQTGLLRRAGAAGGRRLRRSFRRTAIVASGREIGRQMPGADEIEVGLRWVELNYARELADAVCRRLGRR